MKYYSGKLPRTLLLASCFLILPACVTQAAQTDGNVESNLWQFAESNCLFHFFRKKNWELDDIRAISGGYVELGDSGPDTYATISELISEWHPRIETKQDIDIDLLKCFHLQDNEGLAELIGEEAR